MKKLIAYFSWSGNTEKLVSSINKELNIDTIRIERKIPYSENYEECAYKEAKEEVVKKIHPLIKELGVNPFDYGEILLFFPIWWYTFPMPIGTFLETLKGYDGKIILFANSYTNDPQYMVNSLKDAKEIDSSLHFAEGLFNRPVSEHINYIKEL